MNIAWITPSPTEFGKIIKGESEKIQMPPPGVEVSVPPVDLAVAGVAETSAAVFTKEIPTSPQLRVPLTKQRWMQLMLQKKLYRRVVSGTKQPHFVTSALTANVKGEFVRVADFTLRAITLAMRGRAADTTNMLTSSLHRSIGVKYGRAVMTRSVSSQRILKLVPKLKLTHQPKPTGPVVHRRD